MILFLEIVGSEKLAQGIPIINMPSIVTYIMCGYM